KLDGYWLVSDALGVPNLHKRVGDVVAQAKRKLRAAAVGSSEATVPNTSLPLSRGAYTGLLVYASCFVAVAAVLASICLARASEAGRAMIALEVLVNRVVVSARRHDAGAFLSASSDLAWWSLVLLSVALALGRWVSRIV